MISLFDVNNALLSVSNSLDKVMGIDTDNNTDNSIDDKLLQDNKTIDLLEINNTLKNIISEKDNVISSLNNHINNRDSDGQGLRLQSEVNSDGQGLRLQSELDKSETDNKEKQNLLNSISFEKNNNSKMVEENNELQNTISFLRESNNTLSNYNNELQVDKKNLTEEINQVKIENNNLQNELKTKSNEISTLTMKYNRLEAENLKIEVDFQVLNKKLQIFNKNQNEYEKPVDSISSCTSDSVNNNNNINSLLSEFSNKQQKIISPVEDSQYRMLLKQKDLIITTLRHETESLNTEKSRITSLLVNSTRECENLFPLKEKVKEMLQTISVLETQKEAAIQLLAEKQDFIDFLQQDIAELKTMLKEQQEILCNRNDNNDNNGTA